MKKNEERQLQVLNKILSHSNSAIEHLKNEGSVQDSIEFDMGCSFSEEVFNELVESLNQELKP